MNGYRFALMLENGEPANPAVFNTILAGWQEGDTFVAGADLQWFRIVAIDASTDENDTFHAIWVVEPFQAESSRSGFESIS